MCAGKFVRSDAVARVELALSSTGSTRPSPDAVVRVVTAAYGMTQRALETPTRKPPFDEARMITAMLMYEDAGLTKPDISRRLNYSDHTGAYVAIRSIVDAMAVDSALQGRVGEIRRNLQAATNLAQMARLQPDYVPQSLPVPTPPYALQ